MFAAIVVLLFLPYINTSEVRSTAFRPIYAIFYWMLLSDFILLGWVGQKAVDTPFFEIGRFATVFYFLFFLVLVPLSGLLEKALIYRKTK
jgi:ubiquinol-cytochrome c reductase cytochrome b subunit